MYKIINALLTPNSYSRPKTKLKSIKGLVIHWVANPNSTAIANRNFFENRKNGKSSYGSAHYIVDLNGDVIRCLPDDELAYHVGSSLPYKSGSTQVYTPEAWKNLNSNSNKSVKPYPNNCTIGIECTHLDAKGKMSDKTYTSTLELCVDLCKKYKLNPLTDLWLHKEVVGWKDCHKWFVDNPIEWKKFKQLVNDAMNPKNVVTPPKKVEEPVKEPTKEPVKEVKKTEQWKIDLGIESVKYLAKEGIINNPEDWFDKMDKDAENWLLFELLNRLEKK